MSYDVSDFAQFYAFSEGWCHGVTHVSSASDPLSVVY